MAKKDAPEVGAYTAGSLVSFLLGNAAGKGKDQTGGLFSAQAKAKVEAAVPLPGFQDRIGKHTTQNPHHHPLWVC